jgi:predicted transcriptional regulator
MQRSKVLSIKKVQINSHIDVKAYILAILRQEGPLTRDTLVRLTKLPRTTIYDATEKLRNCDFIQKRTFGSEGRGRPIVYFYYIPLAIRFLSKIIKVIMGVIQIREVEYEKLFSSETPQPRPIPLTQPLPRPRRVTLRKRAQLRQRQALETPKKAFIDYVCRRCFRLFPSDRELPYNQRICEVCHSV